MPSRNRKAFTLVELLVVIGIIALLIGLLLPSLNRAREMSRRVACGAQLQDIGRALLMYANDNLGHYPDHQSPEPKSLFYGNPSPYWAPTPASTWWPYDYRAHILPYERNYNAFYCPGWFTNQTWGNGIGADDAWNGSGTAGGEVLCSYSIAAAFNPDLSDSWFLQNDGTYLFNQVGDNRSFANRPLDARRDPTNVAIVSDLTMSYPAYGDGTATKPWGFNHPDGANSLYADGHVAFRPTKELKVQFFVGFTNSAAVSAPCYFW